MEHCETCPYWIQLERDSLVFRGEYHRYPPTCLNGNGNTIFPFIWSDDWCGEHPINKAIRYC